MKINNLCSITQKHMLSHTHINTNTHVYAGNVVTVPQHTESGQLCAWSLTHWGRVTHIYVSELIIIGSDNDLAGGRHRAMIWRSAVISLIRTLDTNFGEILKKFIYLHSRKCIWKCRLRNTWNLSRPQCVDIWNQTGRFYAMTILIDQDARVSFPYSSYLICFNCVSIDLKPLSWTIFPITCDYGLTIGVFGRESQSSCLYPWRALLSWSIIYENIAGNILSAIRCFILCSAMTWYNKCKYRCCYGYGAWIWYAQIKYISDVNGFVSMVAHIFKCICVRQRV